MLVFSFLVLPRDGDINNSKNLQYFVGGGGGMTLPLFSAIIFYGHKAMHYWTSL